MLLVPAHVKPGGCIPAGKEQDCHRGLIFTSGCDQKKKKKTDRKWKLDSGIFFIKMCLYKKKNVLIE